MFGKVSTWSLFYAVSFLLSCFTHIAMAQVTTATVSGVVRDSSQAVLPGCTVVVRSLDTGIERTVITDDTGRYNATNLPLGEYEVSASLPGFQRAVRSGITLTIGREAVVNFTMSVGEVSETITVSGEAPLVETTSGSLGDIVDHRTATDLPLNGRDLTSLLTLQAGTANMTNTATSTNQGFSRKVSISGARPTDNSVLLDGMELKGTDGGLPAGVSGNFIGLESIHEFKIERNSYSAQFGGAAGGAINVVSKSGTNELHGSLYEYIRNDNLDASNFRDAPLVDSSGKFIGKARPEFKRNQFGFSVGGPIVKNKTFFFVNYEGLRERLGLTAFQRLPTADTRRGLLPDARTGQLRPVTLNPDVVPYFDLWPLPGPGAQDLGNGIARQPTGITRSTNEDFYQVRIDHQFSDSTSLFGRITRSTSEQSTPTELPQWVLQDLVGNTFSTIETKKIFSSRLLNTFRIGFNRRSNTAVALEEPATPAALHFVPDSQWRRPGGSPPLQGQISVTGLSSVGIGRGWTANPVNRFQYVDDMVYNIGSHSIKFGFNWQRVQYNTDNPSRPAGQFSFNSLTNFMAGRPSQFRGDILPGTDTVRGLRWNIVGEYIQDDWKVNPKLTLNLGLRHEFFTVPIEVNDKISNVRKPFTDTVPALGSPWFENPSVKSFMPRIGLAYDPFGSGKTAIRAGFGIFYNHLGPEVFRQAATRNYPFGLETNIRGTVPFPGIYQAVINQGVGQSDMHLYPFDYARNPHMIQWNLNVQREILPQTALTAGYAGSRGLNLVQLVNLNTARAETINGRLVFPAGVRVPNPFWSLELSSREMAADSWYHGLQLGLQRRFQQGFQMQLSYTYSKTVDTSSNFDSSSDVEGVPARVAYYWDSKLRKGLSGFDLRQAFVASFVWELPFGARRAFGSNWGRWLQWLAGGWQTSGILNLASGPPATIGMSTRTDLSVLGLAEDFPDLKPGSDNNPVIGSPNKYFDASVFTVPPARTVGNLARNTLIGPGLANFDLSLAKNFTISEEKELQFRAEAFNLFNRPNLGIPQRLVFDASGRILGDAGFISRTATTARQIQFGLRLTF